MTTYGHILPGAIIETVGTNSHIWVDTKLWQGLKFNNGNGESKDFHVFGYAFIG